MKKIYACVSLLLLLAACSTREAVPPRLTDLEKKGLRGAVQSIEQVIYYAVPEHDGTFSVGDTASLKVKEQAGLLERNGSLQFNPDGYLTRIRSPEDSEKRSIVYLYDKGGRLSTEVGVRRDGAADSTFYHYDRHGRLYKHKTRMASAPLGMKITVKYSYGKQDTLDVVTIKASLLWPFIPTYKTTQGYKGPYDYFLETYRGKELQYSGRMFYNDHGWVSKCIFTENKFTDAPAVEIRYDYTQIDEQGNWTERIICCYPPGGGEGEPLYTFIALRQITYFPQQESD